MRKATGNQKKRKTGMIIATIVFAIVALSLVGVLGGLGGAIKQVLVGSCGAFSYVLLAIIALLNIFLSFHFFRKKGTRRVTIYVLVLTLILFIYLQIITTNALFSTLEKDTFSEYLSACYSAGAKAAGGALFGIVAYPLLSLMGKYAAIPIAVLFFVVLFFALLPFMRTTKGEETRVKREKPSKKSKKVDEGPALRLYVDRVRPGSKDGAVLKTRRHAGNVNEETYRLFDVFDATPLTTFDAYVPEAHPDRYDPYREDVATPRDYEDDYEPDFTPAKTEPCPVKPPIGAKVEEEVDENDLPRFMRQASERAQATKKLYGADTIRDIIPEEPTFKQVPPEPEKPLKSVTPAPSADRPIKKKSSTYDPYELIETLDDLKRMNARDGIPYSPIIEEAPQAKAPDAATTEKKESFAESSYQEPVSQKKYEQPSFDAAEEDPFDIAEEEETPSVEEETPTEEEMPFRPTITPREASAMRPTESRPPYTAPSASQKSFGSSFEPETDESQAFSARQRKPRSDIGGTHRTEAKSLAQNTYIPPKQAQQVDIEHAMEEEDIPMRPYSAPPVDFLEEYPPMQDEEGVDELGETLVQALSSFNIHSEIVDHKTGPTFTQFAVTLPDNMSVNKLMPIEKDIKRKLKIEKNIRIVSSVPGLDAIGIEVPKKSTSIIGLRSLINSPNFEKENKLYFAVGVDVSGRMVYADLLKMPHLLVAGSTGSGKSVCLNVMICSMLYHYSPDVVRFIMVDPKMVELSVYQNIPHMVMPNTIIDVGKAINALTWAVNEMDRRYAVFRENHCRNIVDYNEMQKKNGGKKMYYIVVIVDEMADLMSRAKREVEDRIQSITSKARSAGIHLVIATQRPSVDVITGTIKNNIPTRIAFKVTSVNDSRTILDGGGAESLFGNGDMLYCPPDGSEPIRLQGPFLSNDETMNIVEYIKEHNDCRFDGEAEKFIFSDKTTEQDASALPTNVESGDEEDELFADALLSVIQSGQASISKLQRKFRIGYSRAARIIDIMEERGFVTGADSSNKPRGVLITEQEYYELFGDDGIQGAEGE